MLNQNIPIKLYVCSADVFKGTSLLLSVADVELSCQKKRERMSVFYF